MAIPIEKKCPHCTEVKPADAFGTYTREGGKKALQGRCKPCQLSYNRERLKDPVLYAKHLARNAARQREKYRTDAACRFRYRNDAAYRQKTLEALRRRYHSDDAFREKQLARSQARLALTSTRVRRFHALLDHFSDREPWLRRIASIAMNRPDAQGLQWLSSRIDDVCAHYCEA